MWCLVNFVFVYSSGICAWSLVFKSLSLVSIISYFYFRSCIYLSMTSCHIYAKEKMILCRNVSKKNLIWNFPLGVILLCMVWCYKFLLGIAIVVFTLTAFSLTKANYIDSFIIKSDFNMPNVFVYQHFMSRFV